MVKTTKSKADFTVGWAPALSQVLILCREKKQQQHCIYLVPVKCQKQCWVFSYIISFNTQNNLVNCRYYNPNPNPILSR